MQDGSVRSVPQALPSTQAAGRVLPYLAAFTSAPRDGNSLRDHKADIMEKLREVRQKSEATQAQLLDAVATALESSFSPPR